MSDLWVEVADRDQLGIHVVAAWSRPPAPSAGPVRIDPDEAALNLEALPSTQVRSLPAPAHMGVWSLELGSENFFEVAVTGCGQRFGLVAEPLKAPAGPMLSRFATANDVHIGEVECGRIDSMGDEQLGPVLRTAEGDEPYPELMNRTGAAAVLATAPDNVLINGDLTDSGTPDQYARLRRLWSGFGPRLNVVRGNHDADAYTDVVDQRAPYLITQPGLTVAVLDTVRPGEAGGTLREDQIDWLDALCQQSTEPVLVCGHHPLTHPGDDPSQQAFNIPADVSEGLINLARRRDAFCAYTSGHTHRNAMRTRADLPNVAFIEVASLKDYPGVWGRYDVYESGMVFSVRRVLDPDALSWTERTRHMFAGTYGSYALGALGERSAVLRWR
ncbi:MAG: metallophosphoesterase [Acidimicrobiia bacterium]|nr:metallophosphoesterase [Acidimicrobiia bacterium]